MNYINIQLLQQLFQQQQDIQKLSSTFFQMVRICKIQSKYSEPMQVIAAAQNINKRVLSGKKPRKEVDSETSWQFGEFKIFVWIIVIKCLIREVKVSQFNDQDIHDIRRILHSKAFQFIKYEIQYLTDYFEPFPEIWDLQEIQIFLKIMESHSKQKKNERVHWRCVSFSLSTESKFRYFKTPNQCREKWNNHLNPNLNKAKWTAQQDARLFFLISRHGLKWATISKCMNGTRTEHMVKNRYNYYAKIISEDQNIELKSVMPKYLKKQMKRMMNHLNQSVKVQQDSGRIGQPSDEQGHIIKAEALEGSQNLIQVEVKAENQNGVYIIKKEANEEQEGKYHYFTQYYEEK